MEVAALFMRALDKRAYPRLVFTTEHFTPDEMDAIKGVIEAKEGTSLVDGMYNQWQVAKHVPDGKIFCYRMTWQYPIAGTLSEVVEKLTAYYE